MPLPQTIAYSQVRDRHAAALHSFPRLSLFSPPIRAVRSLACIPSFVLYPSLQPFLPSGLSKPEALWHPQKHQHAWFSLHLPPSPHRPPQFAPRSCPRICLESLHRWQNLHRQRAQCITYPCHCPPDQRRRARQKCVQSLPQLWSSCSEGRPCRRCKSWQSDPVLVEWW